MNVDWSVVFGFETPALEMMVRGTVMYLALFTMLRVVLKRQSGTVGISDLLLVVLIADASQGALAGDYRSLPDGLILVATIVGWSYVLDWLGYHFTPLQHLFFPGPLMLVNNGRMIRKNMRQELITHSELMTALRHQGFERVEDVKRAFMEGDGRISAVGFEEQSHQEDQRSVV